MKRFFIIFIIGLFFCIFLTEPFNARATSYVPGEILYPDCNPPELNCGFSVEPGDTIVFIGDSWTAGNHYVQPFYYYINAKYPFAGAGYVPVDSYQYNLPLNYYSADPLFNNFLDPVPVEYEVSRTTVGIWTDTIKSVYGPNIMHTTSFDVSTPGIKSLTCTGTDFKIYYLKKPGGGSFDYSIDSGDIITVSTANGSNALGTVDISSQSLASHAISMTVNVAGATGVTLFGVDCSISNSGGIKIDKLGLSGSRGPQWAAVNTGVWQSQIAQLNPKLVIINLGTNDILSESVDTYSNSIGTIAANIKSASPTTNIVLAPPAIGNRTGPAGDVSAYFPALQDLARHNGYGYIEASKFFGSYDEAIAKELWALNNPGHLSSTGDQLFADILIDYLGLASAPVITSVTGHNPQDTTGGKSIIINGANFVSDSTVTIGGVAVADVTFVSSSELFAVTPANVAGTYDVVVTNYTQSGTGHNDMTYVDHLVSDDYVDDNTDNEKDLNICSVKAESTENTITITWKTDHKTNSTVRYGKNKNLEEKKKDNAEEKNHKVVLKNLQPSTKYYFRIKATDSDGNEDSSRIHSIITKAVPVLATSSSSNKSVSMENSTENQSTPASFENITPSTCSYTVKQSDTLWSIAKQIYGDPTQYKKITDLNPDLNTDTLKIGQELKLCDSNQAQGNSQNNSDYENTNRQTQIPSQTQNQTKSQPETKTFKWWNPFSWF